MRDGSESRGRTVNRPLGSLLDAIGVNEGNEPMNSKSGELLVTREEFPPRLLFIDSFHLVCSYCSEVRVVR